MIRTRGVYFLANDHVIDLAIAFLNSFRKYNPDIPLCLIPYRDDISQLRSLAPIYDFCIYDNADVLAECDRISILFHGEPVGHYRKLAIWSGVFDDFVYIDLDTVVLKNIDFAFEFTSGQDFVVSTSNDPELVQWVWKDTIHDTGKLTPDQIAFAANTGFIVSQRGKMTMEEVGGKLAGALELMPHMELNCIEQPFLNYLIVTSGKRYTGLGAIRREQNRPEIPHEGWAGMDGVVIRNGMVYRDGEPANWFFVHWAGKWQLGGEELELASQAAGEAVDKDGPVKKATMPYQELWEYYRAMPVPGNEATPHGFYSRG